METRNSVRVHLRVRVRILESKRRRRSITRSVRTRNATSVVMSGEETPPKNDNVTSENDTGTQTQGEESKSEMAKNLNDGPPDDDCCPICFGSFTVPCKANCGHWYCGSCILQFWNYSAASKPCKCPMCSSRITSLTPEASLHGQQEQEVIDVLQNVERYNCLFVGGVRGLVQKVRELPLFIKRMFLQMLDPDSPHSYLNEMRIFAMMLSVLYTATPFNFIPTGGVGVVRLFDYAAIALVLILRLVGIYLRRRLTQRVRYLAAAEPLGE